MTVIGFIQAALFFSEVWRSQHAPRCHERLFTSFSRKNRHWWNTGKKYHRIDFVVKVNVGPADMSFELWHQGVKLSKDSSIKAEWHATAAPPPLPQRPLQMNPVFDGGTLDLGRVPVERGFGGKKMVTVVTAGIANDPWKA